MVHCRSKDEGQTMAREALMCANLPSERPRMSRWLNHSVDCVECMM